MCFAFDSLLVGNHLSIHRVTRVIFNHVLLECYPWNLCISGDHFSPLKYLIDPLKFLVPYCMDNNNINLDE